MLTGELRNQIDGIWNDFWRAFAARVAEIDKLKAHHQNHLTKLDTLFASLQHRAFRGEL
jgi:type I restriction enzyme, S subunit